MQIIFRAFKLNCFHLRMENAFWPFIYITTAFILRARKLRKQVSECMVLKTIPLSSNHEFVKNSDVRTVSKVTANYRPGIHNTTI